MIYIIEFAGLSSIVAENLTAAEVRKVKAIKETMSISELSDEAYSSEEKEKAASILDIVRNKVVPTARI